MPQLCFQASWPVDRQNVRFRRKFSHFQGYQALQLWTTREKVTDSINCEELHPASADVDLEQPPVPPTPGPGPQQELEWCVFVCVDISLIDKPTHWTWMRVFPSSYRITSFKIKWYVSIHGSPLDAWGSPIRGLYWSIQECAALGLSF